MESEFENEVMAHKVRDALERRGVIDPITHYKNLYTLNQRLTQDYQPQSKQI